MAISLKVNEKKLIGNLRLAFTDKFKVLAELMQNARRAGASEIRFRYLDKQKVLLVKDDGAGIADFQNLLHVAESGWDEAVVAQDTPYGMGFLSALYACEAVTVLSRGLRCDLVAKEVLEGQSIDVEKCIHSPQIGTELRLEGFEANPRDIISAINRYACGLSLAVFWDDEKVAAPHALEGGLTFVETEIGHISLGGIHNGKPGELPYKRIYYLQGTQVAEQMFHIGWRSTASEDVVHLNPQKFFGRMPDRDCLVDEKVAMTQTKQVVAAAWRKYLEEEYSRLSQEDFVACYYGAATKFLPEIFLRLDFIPRQWLAIYTEPPFQKGEGSNRYAETPERHVYRDDIEAGRVVIATSMDDLCCEEDWRLIAAQTYAFTKGILVLEQNLPEGHWARNHEVDLEAKDWEIEPLSVQAEAQYSGEWVYSRVILCESYRLFCDGLEGIEIREHAISAPDFGIVMPAQVESVSVLMQISSFEDENDSFQEDVYNRECDRLYGLIESLRVHDPAKMLQRVLDGVSKMRDFPALRGLSLNVKIADDGKVMVDLAA